MPAATLENADKAAVQDGALLPLPSVTRQRWIPCRATPRCTRSLCNGHLILCAFSGGHKRWPSRLRRRGPLPFRWPPTSQGQDHRQLPTQDPARLSGAAATRRERLLAPARGRTVLTRPSRWESLDPCDRSTPDRSGLRGYPGGIGGRFYASGSGALSQACPGPRPELTGQVVHTGGRGPSSPLS